MSHFEEIFGLSLDCDIFGSENSSLLPLFGRCNVKGHNLVIFGEPEMLTEVIDFVKKQRVLAVFIVPDWTNHDWHRDLMERATHRFILPVGSIRNDWFPEGSSSAFILDARYNDRATALISVKIPPIDALSCKSWPPRQILSNYDFSPPPVKRNMNVGWFLRWGQGLPVEHAVNCHTRSALWFSHLLQGGGKILRDYSSPYLRTTKKSCGQSGRECEEWLGSGPF